MIVGTAGHIDHGKTSLVRALTGVDTDRLKEEKARGITIELGFAYLRRPGMRPIGFVDVPGHERLVHTMLAGATGIDLALLVIAADDGIMPQTREHVAILRLLGLTRGIVALTKSDLANDARIATVRAEISDLLGAHDLSFEIVPVSTVTGAGIADLTADLARAAEAIEQRDDSGIFRLAIDRCFSVAGAGTVVTGTALSGRVGVGDQLTIMPRGLVARVRSIHANNAAADSGSAGERCALALTGPDVDPAHIVRGDVVAGTAMHPATWRLDAAVTLLATERKPLKAWLPVKFHHGAAEHDARILSLDDAPLQPGRTGMAQIVFDHPAAVAISDRFVLRDTAASRTIGGGTIIDVSPPERHRTSELRRAELAALRRPDPRETLRALLETGRGFLDATAFFRARALTDGARDSAVETLGLITLPTKDTLIVFLEPTWRAYCRRLTETLAEFHASSPDLPGLGQERLRLALTPRLPAPAFRTALDRLATAHDIVLDRSWVRLPSHSVRLSPEDERLWQVIQPSIGGTERFRPPRVRDIAKLRKIDESAVRRVFKLAARRGDVDELAHDHYFLAGTVIEMADLARALADAGGEFSVAEFRDRLDNGRKVAIQILEFFDRQGLTMRRGDIRRINPHKRDLYSSQAQAPETLGRETSPVGRPDFKSGEGRETVLGGFDSCLFRQISKGSAP